MGLTFCYVAATIFNGFCITVSHFNKQKISFPKWYGTFFYVKYFRSYDKKYQKHCSLILHNFDVFFGGNFSGILAQFFFREIVVQNGADTEGAS